MTNAGAWGCGRYPVTPEEYAEIAAIRDTLPPLLSTELWWKRAEAAYCIYMNARGRPIPTGIPELNGVPKATPRRLVFM